MNRLDITDAWTTATRMVRVNRDVLLAIAGVFFLLPTLALLMLVPEPAVPPGATPQVAMEAARKAYSDAAPIVLLLSLPQMAGILTAIIVMTDAGRPTVGQAIRRSAIGAFVYAGAQLLIGLAMGLVLTAAGVVAVASGVPAVKALAIVAAVALGLVAMIRSALVAPVIVGEGERNPVRALVRSWTLTRGNAGRILAFFLLCLVLFVVVQAVLGSIAALGFALIPLAEARTVLGALVESAVSAGALVYLSAILGAIHLQLAAPRGTGRTFA